MRILLFNLAVDVDDEVLAFTTKWLNRLAENVEHIDVITMRKGTVEVSSNVNVYSVGKEKGYSEPRRAFVFYGTLMKLLWKNDYDLCFSHMIPIFLVMAYPFLALTNLPIVMWYAHKSVTATLKIAHHLCDKIVTSAEPSYGYKHDRVEVIGQVVDTDTFVPDHSKTQAEPPLFISVGRVSPIKDPKTFVRAIHELQNRGEPVEGVWIGEPPERDRKYAEEVQSLVEELEVENSLHFIGRVEHDEVTDWYHRCFAHVNLCPTGAPDKVALEAMACEKPSLAANETFNELFGEWSDKLCFRHEDPEDLADKMASVIGLNESERKNLGDELRKTVINHHSLDHHMRELINIFKEIT